MDQQLFERNNRIRQRYHAILNGKPITGDQAMQEVAKEEHISKEAVKQVLYRPSRAEQMYRQRVAASP